VVIVNPFSSSRDAALTWLWDDPAPQKPKAPQSLSANLAAALTQRGRCTPTKACPRLGNPSGRRSAGVKLAHSWVDARAGKTTTDGKYRSGSSAGWNGRKCSRKPSAGIWSRASQLTVAQATAGWTVPDSQAMWRGLGLRESLEQKKRDARELARHRQGCARERAASDRAKARQWHARSPRSKSCEPPEIAREEPPEAQVEPTMVEDTAVEVKAATPSESSSEDDEIAELWYGASSLPSPSRSHQPSPSRGIRFFTPSPNDIACGAPLPGVVSRSNGDSCSNRGSCTPSPISPGCPPEVGSVSRASVSRASTSPGSARVGCLRGDGTPRRRQSRWHRLVDNRKDEFADWPVEERTRYLQAFMAGARGREDGLTAKGLFTSLEELRIVINSAEEEAAVGDIVKQATAGGGVNLFSFVFVVAPEVERRLEEMRYPELFSKFAAADVDGKGLNEGACREALMSLKSFDEDFHQHTFDHDFSSIFQSCAPSGAADFTQFKAVARQLEHRFFHHRTQAERRISIDSGLEVAEQKLHVGELAYLKRSFDAQDLSALGYISRPRLFQALTYSGVVPAVGPMHTYAAEVLEEFEEQSSFTFSEFLDVVRRVRYQQRDAIRDEIGSMLKPVSSPIGRVQSWFVRELPAVLLTKRSCTASSVISEDFVGAFKTMLIDDEDLEDIERTATLAHRTLERARAQALTREDRLAKQLGVNSEMVQPLRVAFWSLSMLNEEGTVGVRELRELLTRLAPRVRWNYRDLVSLLEELAVSRDCETGVRFRGARRSGDSRLRFDGFLRLAAVLDKGELQETKACC